MINLKKQLQRKVREDNIMENIKGKTVNCETCGGEFDASLVRCPYCGTTYEPAAEEEYMGKLENVREELSEHTKDADHAVWKTFKKIFLTAIVVTVIFVLLCIIVLIIPKSGNKHDQEELNSRKQELIQGE